MIWGLVVVAALYACALCSLGMSIHYGRKADQAMREADRELRRLIAGRGANR